MMQISELAKKAGVSVRALRYYDGISLLCPTCVDEQNGYRLYDDAALERLLAIRFYQAVGVSLERIGTLLEASDEERRQALAEQRTALVRRREHIDGLNRLLTPGDELVSTDNHSRRRAFAAENLRAAMHTGTQQIVRIGDSEMPEPVSCKVWHLKAEDVQSLLDEGFAPDKKTILLWMPASKLLKPGDADLDLLQADGSSVLLDCEGCDLTETALRRLLQEWGMLLYDVLLSPAGQLLAALAVRKLWA